MYPCNRCHDKLLFITGPRFSLIELVRISRKVPFNKILVVNNRKCLLLLIISHSQIRVNLKTNNLIWEIQDIDADVFAKISSIA